MVLYRESLTPSVPFHLAMTVVIPMGFGMIAPISILGGVISAIVCYSIALVAFVGRAPRITITEAALSAGRGTIERTFLGDAVVVERNQRQEAIADARTWKVIRAWLPRGVLVTVVDSADPTPSWYFSSRDPERIVAILNGR